MAVANSPCITNSPGNSSFRAFRHYCRSTRRTTFRTPTLKSTISSQSTQEQDPSFDVSSTVVNPAFRVKIDSTHTDGSEKNRTTLRILFISESGVCRGPLAAAAFAAAAEKHGLAVSPATGDAAIECSAAASRDYCIDEPPEASAYLAAECLGWTLPQDYKSRCFLPSADLAKNDLILVMDKFIASDVLREASVFDTIYLEAGFSGKVRNLGEFHPSATEKLLSNNNSNTPSGNTSSSGSGSSADNKVFEIDDPLYGNVGGEEEEDTVYKSALDIQRCCSGLVEFLLSLNAATSGRDDDTSLKVEVDNWLQKAEGVDWMRPPLLSSR